MSVRKGHLLSCLDLICRFCNVPSLILSLILSLLCLLHLPGKFVAWTTNSIEPKKMMAFFSVWRRQQRVLSPFFDHHHHQKHHPEESTLITLEKTDRSSSKKIVRQCLKRRWETREVCFGDDVLTRNASFPCNLPKMFVGEEQRLTMPCLINSSEFFFSAQVNSLLSWNNLSSWNKGTGRTREEVLA